MRDVSPFDFDEFGASGIDPDRFWDGFRKRTPEEQVDAHSRARDILGENQRPSPELKSRLDAAAAELGVEWGTERSITRAGVTWFAVVKTRRGAARCDVIFEEAQPYDAAWEAAFREVGLLP